MLSVLLIEDNQDDIDLTLHSLRRYNFVNEIRVAMDGEEALRHLKGSKEQQTSLGLILLDLKLPKISGLEVLENIKTDRDLARIPVVVLTSSEEAKDVDECYRLGVNSYIVKPVDFKKFMEAIRTLGYYWLLLNKPPSLGGERASR
ncbi:MAG TPA: response regulator [Syntrophobacteria bacterium]|nr:response regulator [Syntrophobacteria bacterium]